MTTSPADLRVAYLATDYPKVSHTFIQDEILALEALGTEVLPMALNPPIPGGLLSAQDHAEAERTLLREGHAQVRRAAHHLAGPAPPPVGLRPLRPPGARSDGWDGRRVLKRLLQLAEAVVVWDSCQAAGISSVHAHFGQAPATVAWFTAMLGTALTGERWTWSVTIHGWHEFVNEEDASLREKVAAADLVVCISDFTRSQLMRIAAPEHWAKLQVVRCGIDLERFPLREKRLTPPFANTPLPRRSSVRVRRRIAWRAAALP